MNVSESQLVSNIRASTALKLPTLSGVSSPPVLPQDRPTILIAGGPSINAYKDYLVGIAPYAPIATVNGSQRWALTNGISPDFMFMVDARPENVKFIDPIALKCVYALASQVHPDVFKKIPRNQTLLWHNDTSPEIRDTLMSLHVGSELWLVRGGPTVTLRALSILSAMGALQVDVFGMDCSFASESHAYEQEPEGEIHKITSHGREFLATDWMLAQAHDFLIQMSHMPSLRVVLHGDGLLSHTMKAVNPLPNVRTV